MVKFVESSYKCEMDIYDWIYLLDLLWSGTLALGQLVERRVSRSGARERGSANQCERLHATVRAQGAQEVARTLGAPPPGTKRARAREIRARTPRGAPGRVPGG